MRGRYTGRSRRWLLWLGALVLAGVLAFWALLGAVLWGGRDRIEGRPGVLVVLGCQVHPWGPSVLLQDRLNTALAYWQEHPETVIVVSGGQGPDEPTTEAQAMYDYLVARGVPAEQIHREETSHNTWENVNYSLALLKELGLEGEGVAVVSNGFHLTRVEMLWRRAGGPEPLSTLAAPSSDLPARLKMYVREPIALVKSFVLDR